MNKKNVKKNYLYNVLYQLFLIIVPLVVTPYVARTLTPNGVGQYSFSYSLTNYFLIFGALGFNYYAQREIAKIQGDKHRQSVVFWEINICRLIPVGIALLIDIIFISFNVYGDYNYLMLIMMIEVFSVALDISFLFQGNEDFGKLVLRNFIIKTISIILILTLVKKESDLWLYTLISVCSVLLSNTSLWGYLFRYLTKVSIKEIHPMRHLRGTLVLFIPTIAKSIYLVLDRTLIGLMVPGTYTVIEDGVEIIKKYSDLENGYYEQSEKLVKMAMTIISCIGTVMIPRNSYEISRGNFEKVQNNIHTSLKIVFLMSLPMIAGLIAISSKIVPWYLGDGYEKCEFLIMIFSPLILIIGMTNVFGVQYLLPSGQDKKYTISLLIGAFVNLLCNLILIPILYSYGAAIATIIAELVILFIMWFMVRKEIKVWKNIVESWRYFFGASVMFVSIWFLKDLFASSSVFITFLLIAIGVVEYFLLLVITRDSLVIETIRKVFRRIKVKLHK